MTATTTVRQRDLETAAEFARRCHLDVGTILQGDQTDNEPGTDPIVITAINAGSVIARPIAGGQAVSMTFRLRNWRILPKPPADDTVRVFVNLIYTIAVDVDPAFYELDGRTLADACNDDPDFAGDHLHNGPHPVHDIDWDVVDDPMIEDRPICFLTTHAPERDRP